MQVDDKKVSQILENKDKDYQKIYNSLKNAVLNLELKSVVDIAKNLTKD